MEPSCKHCYVLFTNLSINWRICYDNVAKINKKKIKGTYKHVSSRYAPAYISVYSTWEQ